MRARSFVVVSVVAAGLLVGCGKSGSSSTGAARSTTTTTSVAPTTSSVAPTAQGNTDIEDQLRAVDGDLSQGQQQLSAASQSMSTDEGDPSQ